ncbi:hypothetical protein [Cryptosporangium minutisporangium]|uniref:Uncharacterized protein n=1 Tax=Cryptosporangium minutisporangium TaxID=113569 RepID=A0ABP6T4T3_9ACTN
MRYDPPRKNLDRHRFYRDQCRISDAIIAATLLTRPPHFRRPGERPIMPRWVNHSSGRLGAVSG